MELERHGRPTVLSNARKWLGRLVRTVVAGAKIRRKLVAEV